MALVTLEHAKQHLRIDHALLDTLIQSEIDQATVLCLQYGDKAALASVADGWTDTTVPLDVKSAILETVELLHRPGDDPPAVFSGDGFLPPSVRGKLLRWHTWAVA